MSESRPERTAESLSIPVSHGCLEALWDEPDPAVRAGAVLCHPHPQYGGTMHTKAMYYAARALNGVGVGVLRFNFRGVGASSGTFDGGDGERQDVRDALDHLKDRVTDRPLLLGGFSFGSVVGLSVARDDSELSGLIGMGLPVTLADVSFLNDEQRPLLLLQGENDQFGPIGQLKEVLDTTRKNVDLRVIEGTEHLFNGKFDVLQEEIRDYFQQAPGKEYLE